MKRRLFYISVIVILLAIISTGSLAYFVSVDTAINIITSGTVEIELEELSRREDATGEVLVPFENVVGVMPGSKISKIAIVHNKGTGDAWVRATVDITVTVTREDGTVVKLDPKYVTLDYNTEDWMYKDGYWYCKEASVSGKTTEPLFNTVTFDIEMGNRYQNSTAVIDVRVQATQKSNNGMTVEDAKGWPED